MDKNQKSDTFWPMSGGSASGSFTIPEGRLNGYFQILCEKAVSQSSRRIQEAKIWSYPWFFIG